MKTVAMVRNDLSAANNRFGFALLNQILKQDSDRNVLISPISIATALAMAYNGASGDTQQAMARTLQLKGMALNDVNTAFAALRVSLMNADELVQLSIANSLQVPQMDDMNPDFLQRNQQFFQAQVQELIVADANAAGTINNNVSQGSNNKIPSQAMLDLRNSFYFRCVWSDQFFPHFTTNLPFLLLDGKQSQVAMMTKPGMFTYWKGDNFQVVRLPYAYGRLNMLVFLPDPTSSLNAFVGQLNETNWAAWVSHLHEAVGYLRLPRFQLQYGMSLSDALKALGKANAFDPQVADFSAMHNGPDRFYINDIQHETHLEVNEEGSEAGAETLITLGTPANRQPSEPFTMTVDRSFFVAIRDNTTEALLFTGVIVQL